MHVSTLAFIGNLAGGDLIVIGLVALLIFGKRLPEVGKNLGKTIVEFKKGLNAKPPLEEEVAEEEEEAPRPVKRLQSGSRVSVSSGNRAKSLPTTEEV